jgi:hypothetical protein
METKFLYGQLDKLEVKGNVYGLFMPIDEEDSSAKSSRFRVIIMREIIDGNGKIIREMLKDEKLHRRILDLFLQNNDNAYISNNRNFIRPYTLYNEKPIITEAPSE